MKIASVVGARPQFIKAAAVSRVLRREHREILVHTGQHYDYNMSRLFFEELEIPEPDYNLSIGSGPHGWQTGSMLREIEKVLLEERPDWVVVYGDTNSTLAAALAAVKLHIPLAHVEAGLRSFNRAMPEEHNRVLTDHASSLLLCPTATAVENLAGEGIRQAVYNIGDVMYDSSLLALAVAQEKSTVLEEMDLDPGGYLLATVHRQENTDDPSRLRAVLDAFGACGEAVVFPAHPRTTAAIEKADLAVPDNVRIIKPVGYLDMLMLEKCARKVLTDSGGVQKEAYFLETPCLTLRKETEWVETEASGWNRVVDVDKDRIADALQAARPASRPAKVFGDGHAGERVAHYLVLHADGGAE